MTTKTLSKICPGMWAENVNGDTLTVWSNGYNDARKLEWLAGIKKANGKVVTVAGTYISRQQAFAAAHKTLTALA